MPGSSNNNSSFIPKRGPAQRRKPKTKNQIFLFSIITYSLLFASLLAAGGTFFYKNYLTSQLQSEVTSLNTAITTFSTKDLISVREFDVTLKRATERINNSASLVSILDALDSATVQPVQLQGLILTRNGDESFDLQGTVLTSSFDAALFQRKIFNANQEIFSDVQVTEVLVSPTSPNTDQIAGVTLGQEVTFNILLNVPLQEVPYDPAIARKSTPVFTSPVDQEVIVNEELNI